MPIEIAAAEISTERNLWRAMGRGVMLRCPHCGKGHMFRAYLKVADTCDVCGEDLSHHRADDMPPYLSILIVGHVIVGLMLHMEMSYKIEPWVYVVSMVPAALILPLVLLPSIKGAVVGLQWANRMFGFAAGKPDPARAGYP